MPEPTECYEAMMRTLILTLFVLICSALPAFAEVYSWTDDRGIEVFTDDVAKVPGKYRNKAVTVGEGDGGSFNVIEQPHTAPAGKAGRKAGAEGSASAYGLKKEKKAGRTPLSPLADTLKQGAGSDREKALAVYDWIYKYINYDRQELRNYIGGKVTKSQDPLTVVKTQKAVCLGFANLFSALAEELGLESTVVTGLGAGGYVLGIGYYGPHAWNAVKIDGKWELVDTVFRNFLSPPDKFIYKHFPYDPQWQLLDPPLSREAWQKSGK